MKLRKYKFIWLMVLVEVDVKLVFNVIIVKLMGLKVVGVMV